MNKFKLPHAKQSGFSLLELIVVIAIIGLLSLGAIVVYDGLTDKAQTTVSTANAAGLDTALREYRATALVYPDKWDNLAANAANTPVGSLASITKTKFASADISGAAAASIKAALTNAGISNLMQVADGSTPASIEPNDYLNATGGNSATVTTVSATQYVSILPTYGSAAACTVGGTALPTVTLDAATTIGVSDGNRQNVINADLGATTCNLVLALGFGREAARATNGKAINMSTAPLYVSGLVNPAKNYARYIALFHVGQDGYTRSGATAGTAGNNDIEDGEIFTKAKLLTVLDPEGKTIEENITAQNK
jgi:prepilin-type N-terminal cleavage/methylation domain-containing protein